MDPAEARRQRETLDTLRRVEDIVGDVNREVVRVEGLVRETLEVGKLVLGGLRELDRYIRGNGDEGGAGVREPREPAPESPGDEPAPLPADYWESAQ